MTVPSAIIGLLCALLVASLFHLVVDGGGGRLLLYSCLSILGFAAGQGIATSRAWSLIPIGPLQLGPSVIGSLVVLVLGHWLSLVSTEGTD